MAMRRITVDEVRKAAEIVGFEIVQGLTIDRASKCGCPIGVLARERSAAFGLIDLSLWAAGRVIGLDDRYRSAFADAFDGRSERGCLLNLDFAEVARLGREDGIACRRAFVEDVR